jgi:broad specificity phosphatase PhoE
MTKTYFSFPSFNDNFYSRHGQSEYNAIGRIGGDSGLTQHGINYAKKLAEFVEEKVILYSKYIVFQRHSIRKKKQTY